MAKTFMQMVQEAKSEVPGVSPVEAKRRFEEDPDALLLEVRDVGNIPVDEKVPNMVNISLGTLPIRQTWKCQKSVATHAYKTVHDRLSRRAVVATWLPWVRSCSRRRNSLTWLTWAGEFRLGRTLACPRINYLSAPQGHRDINNQIYVVNPGRRLTLFAGPVEFSGICCKFHSRGPGSSPPVGQTAAQDIE